MSDTDNGKHELCREVGRRGAVIMQQEQIIDVLKAEVEEQVRKLTADLRETQIELEAMTEQAEQRRNRAKEAEHERNACLRELDTARYENASLVEAVDHEKRMRATEREAPPGHIIDDAGVVRKVLGTLPVTADGCVATIGVYVWNVDQWSNHGKVHMREDDTVGAYFGTQWRPIDVCYSTREAAEAAKALKVRDADR